MQMARRGGLKDLLHRFPLRGKKISSCVVFDSFTELDVNKWLKYGSELRSYAYKAFFGYEAQRASAYEELSSALLETAIKDWSQTGWHRTNSAQYHSLSSKGSMQWVGGRFNFGKRIDNLRFQPFPALYLASDRDTAVREVYKKTEDEVIGDILTPYDLALQDPRSITWAVVDIKLSLVYDLTVKENLMPFLKVIKDFRTVDGLHEISDRLGLPRLNTIKDVNVLLENLLKPNWEEAPTIGDHPSNSQVFGKLVKDAGIEGILYPSVRGSGSCIAIYPENLAVDSYVKFSGQPPYGVAPIQLDYTNYSSLC
jgi:hypothetical protein